MCVLRAARTPAAAAAARPSCAGCLDGCPHCVVVNCVCQQRCHTRRCHVACHVPQGAEVQEVQDLQRHWETGCVWRIRHRRGKSVRQAGRHAEGRHTTVYAVPGGVTSNTPWVLPPYPPSSFDLSVNTPISCCKLQLPPFVQHGTPPNTQHTT